MDVQPWPSACAVVSGTVPALKKLPVIGAIKVKNVFDISIHEFFEKM